MLFAAGTLLGADVTSTAPAASPIMDPEKEGLELAARLLSAMPAASSETRGLLEIRTSGGRITRQRLQCVIAVTATNWMITYRAGVADGNQKLTVLTILHAPLQTNIYRLEGSSDPSSSAAAAVPLTTPFAGSDFSLQDLGLEFLHWPIQRALRSEMSRGRPCRVLESVTPQPGPGSYARVLSWVDLETGGILQAEAYAAQSNRPLKKFALGSFEKVKGQWQLRDMRMRNLKTGTQSELKFQLNRPSD